MNVWVDLANSPQVLFFRPILAGLKALGHRITITTRPYAQTVGLTERFSLAHTPIGGHGGRSLRGLAIQNFVRAARLLNWASGRGFDLALSHNSYSQILAARLAGIPVVTLMDYEHQPLNHLAFRLARRVIVPEVFPDDRLAGFGARRKAKKYPGIKEQVYLSDFVPQADFRRREGLPEDAPLVVIRPPADWTAYHRFENRLFDSLLDALSGQKANGACLLFLPRLASQAEAVRGLPGLRIADKIYDGPDLLYHADLVVSGGGTMNREAAVLGAPTWTVFRGKPAAVDRSLIEAGRMVRIDEETDLARLRIPQTAVRELFIKEGLVDEIIALL